MRFRPPLVALVILTMLTLASSAILQAGGKRLVKKPAYDPSASRVELFEGIEQSQLRATLVPKTSLEGSVFIENLSDKPITVTLPKAVAAVQVLKQGFGAGALGGRGGGGQAGGAAGGQGQAVGGGFGGGGGAGVGGGVSGAGGGVGGGIGAGFFTVPPQKTVQISLTSVCLEHGKAEPRVQMTYKLVPLENYTGDAALQELLVAVGSGELEPAVAQAAAWHLSNSMSWEKLSAKAIEHLGGVDPEPYFSEAQIADARQFVAAAQSRAKQRAVRDRQQSSPRRESRQ